MPYFALIIMFYHVKIACYQVTTIKNLKFEIEELGLLFDTGTCTFNNGDFMHVREIVLTSILILNFH